MILQSPDDSLQESQDSEAIINVGEKLELQYKELITNDEINKAK